MAQVVSELGDWLNLVALFQIIAASTPKAGAAGWVLIMQMIPWIIWSPLAGIVADRFDRRWVMIAADLIRAVLVLGFLAVDRPDRIWLLYLLAGTQFSVTAFFEPARSALLPTLAEGEELVTANALGGVTWSTMLAIGGAFGGLIAALLSVQAAFIIDSFSFLASAALLFRLAHERRLPSRGEREMCPAARETSDTSRAQNGGIGFAFAELRARPRLLATLLVKTGLGLSGGGIWLLTVIMGQRTFPMGEDGAISVGLFYGAHGVGALIGAAMTGRFFRAGATTPLAAILWAFVLRAGFFWLLGAATSFPMALVAAAGVAACGSLLWVASTTLLQRLSTDEMRGRLFALELGALTTALTVALWGTGAVLDSPSMTPPRTAYLTAGVAATVAAVWGVVWNRWSGWGRRESRGD